MSGDGKLFNIAGTVAADKEIVNAEDIIQLFHTFLCNSQNYHSRGDVDDPMHCCPRPKAEGNSASGHPQHRGGDSFDCCTEMYEIVVLLPNSEDTCYWKYFLKFE